MSDADRQIELRAALAAQWVRAERAVSAYVFSAVTSFADAEDVIQQVAVEAARRFEEYDPARPFEAWAIWLAKSRIIDHYRKQGRDRHVFSDAILEKIGEAQIRLHRGSDGRREALAFCLDALPDASRRLVQLRYDDGLPHERIADHEGKNAGAIRIALHRIRNTLAECITRRMAEEAAR